MKKVFHSLEGWVGNKVWYVSGMSQGCLEIVTFTEFKSRACFNTKGSLLSLLSRLKINMPLNNDLIKHVYFNV